MNTQRLLLRIALTVALATVAGCGGSDKAGGKGPSPFGTATVKLTKNGQLATEYRTEAATAVRDIFEFEKAEGTYRVTASGDDKQVLTLDIAGQSTGKYPFFPHSENLSAGKAEIALYLDAVMAMAAGVAGRVTPESGEVQLTTATKTRCVGTFRGETQNIFDGNLYVVEGTFDVPVLQGIPD